MHHTIGELVISAVFIAAAIITFVAIFMSHQPDRTRQQDRRPVRRRQDEDDDDQRKAA